MLFYGVIFGVLLRISCLLLILNCQFMLLESITIGRNNMETKLSLEDEDVPTVRLRPLVEVSLPCHSVTEGSA